MAPQVIVPRSHRERVVDDFMVVLGPVVLGVSIGLMFISIPIPFLIGVLVDVKTEPFRTLLIYSPTILAIGVFFLHKGYNRWLKNYRNRLHVYEVSGFEKSFGLLRTLGSLREAEERLGPVTYETRW